VALGLAAAVGGWVEAILGLAAAPETGDVSWPVVTNGLANETVGAIAVRDGLNLIDTGLHGVQHNSTLADLGGYFGGERGQEIGDFANAALVVRDFGRAGPKNGLGSTLVNFINTSLPAAVESLESCQWGN
jgi:hypothetical protein